MKYKIEIYSIWEFGQRKDAEGNPHQEDSMYPSYGEATPADRLFILCDGMGGHDAGEVASATVCEAMSESILASEPEAEGAFTRADFDKALDAAFKALDAHDTGAFKKMGTTMTMLKLFDGGACIAHMGDSRVYHIRPGATKDDTKILFETEDHSLVNDLIRIGELTPEEAKHSSQKNVITRAMQPNMDPRPRADVKWITDVQAGDYFYLCSDGMLENMENEQICYNFSEAAGDIQKKVQTLTLATAANRDNHTAFLVHVLEVIGEPVPCADAQAEDTPKKTAAPIAVPPRTEEQAAYVPQERAAAPAHNADSKKPNAIASLLNNKIVCAAIAVVTALVVASIIWLMSSSKERVEVPEAPLIEVPQDDDNNQEKPSERKSTRESAISTEVAAQVANETEDTENVEAEAEPESIIDEEETVEQESAVQAEDLPTRVINATRNSAPASAATASETSTETPAEPEKKGVQEKVNGIINGKAE